MFHQGSSQSLIGQAPAKVNLYLRVLSRRPDGFHELETVMVKLADLVDSLTWQRRDDGHLTLRVRQAYPRGLGRIPIPTDANNLVLKAAQRLQKETGTRFGAHIELLKRIPPAAGLGGGSSDAGITLVALNRLWETKVPQEVLLQLAADLGSDVPFFAAKNACMLGSGRGEILTPIPLQQRFALILARPAFGLSTPAVYRACHPEPEGFTAQEFISQLHTSPCSSLAHRLHNSLQEPAERLNADVGRLRELFSSEGITAHQMTGSGSAYFGICSSMQQARHVAERLKQLGIPWVYTSTTAV